MSRAIAVETPRGWRIAKEKSAHKIDVIVALAMSAYGAIQRSHVEPVKIVQPGIWSKNGGWISDPCPTADAGRTTTQKFYDYYNNGGGSSWPGSSPSSFDW